MRLYVASSWRNPFQPSAVELLRAAGHEVYDFRHPPGGDHLGFSWDEIDTGWRDWEPGQYLEALTHPVARAGFESDFGAMAWADAGVLVLPCGRSAHLEAGWFVGAGKPLYIVLDVRIDSANREAELMYAMSTAIVRDFGELLAELAEPTETTA